MTHPRDNTSLGGVDGKAIQQVVQTLTECGLDGMADAISLLLNESMKLERSAFLQAGPYERAAERRGYANGYKDKTLRTRVGELALAVPQVRDTAPGVAGFYPRSLERGLRSERALKLAIAEMYVQGVSTRRVREITAQLCGLDVSSTDVSRATALLDEELESWRRRPLGEVPYLILDARYEKVRHGGTVVDCAVLIAVGVLANGRRSILGVSVSLSEAEVHWREFLSGLLARGLHGVRLIVSDDHEGLKAARKATLPAVPWQRCQFHLQQNAQAYIPTQAMRREVAEAIRAIFNAPDRTEADRLLTRFCDHYRKTAPKLATWAEQNIPEGLAVFVLPAAHRRRLRTTNGLERLNQEIRRRTAVAHLFPNDASLLRLVSAVLCEISEEWEAERIYLNMESA